MYAGLAGATHVTTVDVADAALKAADTNWQLNDLNPKQHEGIALDAFDLLDRAAAAKEQWDVVICDPPSFAPNKASVVKAQASYERLFQKAAAVTARWVRCGCGSCGAEKADLCLCQDGCRGDALILQHA